MVPPPGSLSRPQPRVTSPPLQCSVTGPDLSPPHPRPAVLPFICSLADASPPPWYLSFIRAGCPCLSTQYLVHITESERHLKGGTHCETMLYVGTHTLCTCEGHKVATEVLCRSLSTLFCDTGSLSRPRTVFWPDWLASKFQGSACLLSTGTAGMWCHT